jgi:hypothetical protein
MAGEMNFANLVDAKSSAPFGLLVDFLFDME